MIPSNRMQTRTSAKPDEFKPVKGFIALMSDLARVMAEEAELLNARNFGDHKELVRKKQRLTMDYRAGVKSLSAQPDMLKALPDNIRAALRDAAQKLSEATDRNARFLRAAILATQRLLQSVVTLVKAEALPKAGYGNPRDARSKFGAYSPVCKPVTGIRTA